MSADPVEFVRARLDEDEAAAKAAESARWVVAGGCSVEVADFPIRPESSVFEWMVVFDEGSPETPAGVRQCSRCLPAGIHTHPARPSRPSTRGRAVPNHRAGWGNVRGV